MGNGQGSQKWGHSLGTPQKFSFKKQTPSLLPHHGNDNIRMDLTTFPDDWMEEIFMCLDFRSQCRLCRVTQRWRRLIGSPFVQQNLIFYIPVKHESDCYLDYVIGWRNGYSAPLRKAAPNVRSLTLTRGQPYVPDMIGAARRFSRLKFPYRVRGYLRKGASNVQSMILARHLTHNQSDVTDTWMAVREFNFLINEKSVAPLFQPGISVTFHNLNASYPAFYFRLTSCPFVDSLCFRNVLFREAVWDALVGYWTDDVHCRIKPSKEAAVLEVHVTGSYTITRVNADPDARLWGKNYGESYKNCIILFRQLAADVVTEPLTGEEMRSLQVKLNNLPENVFHHVVSQLLSKLQPSLKLISVEGEPFKDAEVMEFSPLVCRILDAWDGVDRQD